MPNEARSFNYLLTTVPTVFESKYYISSDEIIMYKILLVLR